MSRKKALDPSQSFIVQAPAGSGKTELLIQRLLVLLANVDHPQQIIAITFTRKAATEMRQRLVTALINAKQSPQPEQEHAKFTWQLAKQVLEKDNKHNWNLIENSNQLRIQTIDSLCHHISQQAPITSNFGTQVDIIEDARHCYQQAATQLVNSIASDQPWVASLESLLLHLDNNPQKLTDMLANMLAHRDQWLAYVVGQYDQHALRQTLEQSLQNVILDSIHKLAAAIPSETQSELLECIQFAALHLTESALPVKSLPDISLAAVNQWQAIAHLLLTKSFNFRKQANKSIGFPSPNSVAREYQTHYKDMKQLMQNLLTAWRKNETLRDCLQQVACLPNDHYADQQWDILLALLQLLPVLTAELLLVFKEQQAVDFIEINLRSIEVLGSSEQPSTLALQLDYQIQHILIDEFQDTSITQYRLIESLIAGWQVDDGRTLFLVGDPMQSIYRFRQAEVGLFLKARQQGIGSVTLHSIVLNNNFRSSSQIIEWNNKIFSKLFPQQDDVSLGAIPYFAATAGRTESADHGVQLHCLDTLEPSLEANKIIGIIKQSQQQDPDQQIAILVRNRSHLSEIITALQTANLPYQANDIDNLTDKPIIQDLLALTKALLNPCFRTSWLSILRAPWCGLTLHDLHCLASDNHQQALLTTLTEYQTLDKLSDDAKQRLAKIVPVLQTAMQQRRRLPLRTWISQTWVALGGPACLTDPNDLDCAELFFQLLQRFDVGYDLSDLNQFESELFNTYADQAQDPNVNIHLMTIHKAKGLEFDTVILPGLAYGTRYDAKPLLLWAEYPRATSIDLLMAPIHASEQQHDPIYSYLRQQQSVKNQLEMCRLLYVACTRAKHQLHVLIPNTQPSKNSFLNLLQPALPIQFSDLPASELTEEPLATSHQLHRLTSDWFT